MKLTPFVMATLVTAGGIVRSEDAATPETQHLVRTPDPAIEASIPVPLADGSPQPA